MQDRREIRDAVSVYDHFVTLLAEREKRMDEKFASSQNAVELAKSQMEHRLEGMNEFQKRIDRIEATFATRSELKVVEKLAYIGVGIVLAIQFIMILLSRGGF